MIKAIIADDSAFLRQVLKDSLNQSNKIIVVAEAKNGKEALALVKENKPDVLILDCEMPVMNGLEALRHIMSECPLPVFMFSSLTQEGAAVTLKALEYGAVDFLPKPTKGAHALEEVADQLIKKIEIIVRKDRLKHSIKHLPSTSTINLKPAEAPPLPHLVKTKIDIIAIGSSTGGVQAAMEIVKNLPQKTKPIVWVQHMPPNFTKGFATRLNTLSKITIKEAEDGEKIEDNTCYIGRGGYQMRVYKRGSDFYLKISGDEKVSGHSPSCNVLFESVAEHFSNNALGVILTGMGDDGAQHLLGMHKKGAFVIGQNEESSVVYGMPKSATAVGAVDVELDIKDIANAIVKKGGGLAHEPEDSRC